MKQPTFLATFCRPDGETDRQEVLTLAEIEAKYPAAFALMAGKNYLVATMKQEAEGIPNIDALKGFSIGFESVDSYGKPTWRDSTTLAGCKKLLAKYVGLARDGYVSDDGVSKCIGLRAHLDYHKIGLRLSMLASLPA